MKNISKIANEILSPFFGPSKQDLVDRITADWKKNQDGSYDVDGDVRITNNFIENGKLTVKFNHVSGDFNCRDNELTSLQGCPKVIRLDFDCSYNNLTSLEGSPKTVGRDFYCLSNIKDFTRNEVKSICDVKGGIFV